MAEKLRWARVKFQTQGTADKMANCWNCKAFHFGVLGFPGGDGGREAEASVDRAPRSHAAKKSRPVGSNSWLVDPSCVFCLLEHRSVEQWGYLKLPFEWAT
jgi:hypothetical protein